MNDLSLRAFPELARLDEIVKRCQQAVAALVDAKKDVRMVAGEELARQVDPLYAELDQFLLDLQRFVLIDAPHPRGMDDLPIIRDIIRHMLKLGRELTLAQCQLVAYASREAAAAALRDLVDEGYARPVWDVASPWVRYARATPDQDE